MRKFFLVLPLSLLLLCCHGKKTGTTATAPLPPSNLNEPDRVLFERAMKDMEKSRFTVARLTLQTLISTYPDSEFLPQAKYANNTAQSRGNFTRIPYFLRPLVMNRVAR